MKKKNIPKKGKMMILGLIILEVALLALFFSFIPSSADAVIGNPNATVATYLQVGNVFPEVRNVSINNNATTFTLIPNSTRSIWCAAVIRDFNGDTDINASNATFYAKTSSNYSATDDNNYHYTNTSCVINTSFGSFNGFSDDAYTALSNCTFDIWYYAVAEPWECQVWANDSYGWWGNNSNLINISQLLAIGLPDLINYSTVNATYISDEQIANVTNLGNTRINMSVEGYARVKGDGYAMNCTLGTVQNISVQYEKYNLTATTLGTQSHLQANLNYTNLSTTPVVKNFSLAYRLNDTENEAIKASYWRMYVPVGVAGTCTGNILFGATTANGN